MIRPFSSTMMQSEFLTVESLCAMTKVVRPFISESMPFCTSRSVRVSMEEVASSRMSTGGSAMAVLAMERSWRSPWLRLDAVPLMTVR